MSLFKTAKIINKYLLFSTRYGGKYTKYGFELMNEVFDLTDKRRQIIICCTLVTYFPGMKHYVLLLLLLLNFFTGNAQSDYMFFHLSLHNGLSDARVTAINQDKIGFMWFGTPNGLNRYDGYSIKVFYADKRNGLPSNNIRAIFSDSKGRLWIGTDRGLVQYNFSNEVFESPANSGLPENTSVFCFAEDVNGNIYAGTENGIFRCKKGVHTWENYSAVLGFRENLILVKGLLFFNNDILFATTEKKGFYKINIKTRAVNNYGVRFGDIDDCCLSMFGLEKLNDKELLIGTLSYGLFKFNTVTNTFSTPKGVLQKRDGILFNSVSQIKRDHAQRIWVASNYFSLSEYLPGQDTVVSIGRESFNPYGFEGNNAYSLYEDRQHNIWIGTILNGVYHFNPNRKRVRFHYGNDVPGALQRGKVLSMAALDSNTLMIGTNAGPSIYTRNTNTFLNYKGAAFNFGDKALEQVTAALKDRHGMVWIGSSRLGLMRYDLTSKKFRVFGRRTKPVPFEDDGITDMLELEGDSLMVIGYSRPAIFRTQTFTSSSARNDSITPLYQLRNVSDLCFDPAHKNVWLSVAPAKLYEYNLTTKALKDRTSLINSSVKPSTIYKIAFDFKGRMWCASNIGAICLEPGKPANIYSIQAEKGASAEIKNILPFDNDIWLTNDRSMARLNPETGAITILGEQDGFRGVQLFGHSLIRSPWNTILIGCNYGFYEIYPDKIKDDRTASSAYLTAFRVYDKPFATKEAISTLKEIRLKYNQNFFSFDMSPFDYSEANDLEYAYKLEGFDKDWIYVGKQRRGSYTNVPGGDYILKLKVRNNSGVWNERGQSIRIHINKPFWETWWFYALVTIIIACSIYLIYRNRVGGIRRQARLRSDYEIKLNELENSALRTQMNPHFIFNSLNTINSFINRNEPAKANQYISKFSKLIRLILDHSREKKITLAEEIEVVALYVSLERIRFDDKFDVEIKIDDEIETDSTEIPPLIVQPFVENAILHGLLPLPGSGLLKVNVIRNEDYLLIVVEDNGIGRKKAGVQKFPSREQRKSHGIEITLKRIELFNKEHNFPETVRIIDLQDDSGNALGTKVEIPIAWEESF
jgi:ligand-binding sensor domain-containing protein